MKPLKIVLLMVGLSVLSACSNAQPDKGAAARSVGGKTDLTPPEFKAAVAHGPVQLVDVRTPGEFSQGHLAGSVNIDWMAPDHEAALAKLDPKVPVLLYCQAGGRSGQALEHLKDRGYKVQHLAGGFGAWQKAGYPDVK